MQRRTFRGPHSIFIFFLLILFKWLHHGS
jgi:hypothetical protein